MLSPSTRSEDLVRKSAEYAEGEVELAGVTVPIDLRQVLRN